MEYDIRFYEIVIGLLRQAKEILEIQTHEALSERARQCSQELQETYKDYIKIIQDELYKLYFWDYILSDSWCRAYYYGFSDDSDW